MRPRIFVTRRVPEPVRVALEARFDVRIHDAETPPTRDELLRAVPGCEGLVTMLTDEVDAELLDAAGPQLRVVANYATGIDNVDVEEATERGVLVSSTPGVLEEATAELTLALVLSLLRRVAEGDRLVRRGEPWRWAPTFLVGSGVRGRTLGIVGLGRIGREVARLARAHGMEITYTNRSGPSASPYEWLPLPELLARADVVTLHVPLTDDTRHLIGGPELRRMRRGAVLVNTARGPLVDEAALAAALRAGEIAGAALDVFEDEPAVHPDLLALEDVVLTPHLGSATYEAREAMGRLCVEALEAVLLENRAADTAVNEVKRLDVE